MSHLVRLQHEQASLSAQIAFAMKPSFSMSLAASELLDFWTKLSRAWRHVFRSL
jgi:hypothetical protein